MFLPKPSYPEIITCVPYYKGKEIECLVPFMDEASVENAIVCWATMLAMGYSPAEAG